MNVTERFSKTVIAAMQRFIDEADGNEVFFTGHINGSGIVESFEAAARGNESSEPVNFSKMRECSVLIHNHQ